MLETFGQRSIRAEGSKNRESPLYFSIWICRMFVIWKCRGKDDLGLCTASGLAKRMPLRGGNFRFKNVFGRKNRRKLPLRSGILLACSEVVHKPRSDFPLHFDIRNTYTKLRLSRLISKFFQKIRFEPSQLGFYSKFGLSRLNSKFFPTFRIYPQIRFGRSWPLLSWAGSTRIFNIWV